MTAATNISDFNWDDDSDADDFAEQFGPIAVTVVDKLRAKGFTVIGECSDWNKVGKREFGREQFRSDSSRSCKFRHDVYAQTAMFEFDSDEGFGVVRIEQIRLGKNGKSRDQKVSVGTYAPGTMIFIDDDRNSLVRAARTALGMK